MFSVGKFPTADHSRGRIFYTSIAYLITAIAFYLWTLNLYIINIPFLDDFNDILRFIVKFEEAETLSERIDAFFEQHSQPSHVDHRTMASRLMYLAVYCAQGVIDFKVLAYAANATMLMIVYGVWRGLKRNQYRYFWIALVVAVLLDIRQYSLISWPMSAFAFYCSYGYALLALIFLSGGTGAAFVLSLVLAILATYSLVSGALIWPIGLLSIIYSGLITGKRHWVFAVVWISTAAIVLSFYFTDYKSSVSIISSLQFAGENTLLVIQFFLAMCGSQFGFGNVWLAQAAGALILCLFFYHMTTTERAGFTHLHFFSIFVILSIGLVVAGRAYALTVFNLGLEVSLVPRYSLGSKLLIVTLLALTANRINRISYRQIVLALFGVFLLSAGNFAVFRADLQARYEVRIKQYNKYGIKIIHSDYFRDEVPIYADKAIENGMYVPPPRPMRP
ncbi:MAG: hypothetical protein ABJK25_13830 [Halieaceae bacterium]